MISLIKKKNNNALRFSEIYFCRFYLLKFNQTESQGINENV